MYYIVYLSTNFISYAIITYVYFKFLTTIGSYFYSNISMVYTTIPHSKLGGRLKEFVPLCFIK